MRKTLDPIAHLMQEHDTALLQLKKLNRAVQSFSVDGYSPKYYREIVSALKFIDEEVRIHNRKEEEALFPVIERYVEGPTNNLRRDHKTLRKEFIQLAKAVENVKRHRDSFSRIKNLVKISQSVAQIFVNHIHKENHILFPLVQRFLSKDELREIAKRMQ